MRPVVLSRHARADLREIAAFIAADNPARAASFVAELRILVFRAYLILHRVHDDAVRIDRVVHADRDLSALWPHD